MNKTISITELKTNTAKVLEEVKVSGTTISVVQRSRLAAVILEPAVYEQLLTALEDLEDIKTLRSLNPNEPTVSHEQIGKELGLI
ncbi:MAG: hypothetical protein A3A61_02555 [Candidatus Woykebacteria bacterium RIFCSPLOWO2_01_FULL_43_14]|uniref:Antitoxin n=2 Tax=Candidatus Woykeibacteriota TaxID=1817899 RepID=A0A1G1WSB6_9BACT|nr:MAG: hypothetical protein A3J50_01725 [Candidatus Woykebacteria bacterium RIFCSPHIGHO2_02_FULL_43_16b]OGY30645.1 MAG: hypothetical protein A3A61_02555 [Candidatus Woykebacteria bacterium RIFCSPLOWO2_01_FULL_43_14]